ncbi:MAG TPA: PAC2 family protein [Propionibacteriaceae bacterium]|nr:PAC2 family protein [Propionibacteriaceae bacterium]
MADNLSTLRDPVVICAFEGWNDASDSATEVINHLGVTYDADVVFELDGQDFYDFQVNRPQVTITEDGREIEWPVTSLSIAETPERDLVLVSGPEPNMKWKAFCEALVSGFRTIEPKYVVLLGAMITDAPHSRPLPVSVSTEDATLGARLGAEPSTYEGPTGIVGILGDACRRVGMTTVSLWASVPHYVSNPPNPKASLALLNRLEDLLDQALDLGELPEMAKAWERGVDELAAQDPEIAEYITSLEQQQDESELPEATGDSIAAEFQRYLRRRDQRG